MCLRIGKNPPMGDLTFANNIWCDPTGRMPRFSDSEAQAVPPGSKQVLLNNLYWNTGKPVPAEAKDVLTPDRDAKRIVADPRLGSPGQDVTLPRWDPSKGTFLSGQKTIRGEFERLVKLYGTPTPGKSGDSRGRPGEHAQRRHSRQSAWRRAGHRLLRAGGWEVGSGGRGAEG